MRGSISTTVTFVPSALNREANSQPSTPPPTINRLSGIVVRSNASRLVMTRVPSMGRVGRDGGVVPVPRITASACTVVSVPSGFITRTVFASARTPRPSTSSTFQVFSRVRTPFTSPATILFLRSTMRARS